MRARQLDEAGGLRTFMLVFETDEDVLPTFEKWVQEHEITGASFNAIGAFRRATLAYFDIDRREYAPIPVEEQVEVLTLAGNVAMANGKPKIHAHVVVGRRDGTTCGGHLLDAQVRPTLELVLVETPATLRRTVDEATGLPLLDP